MVVVTQGGNRVCEQRMGQAKTGQESRGAPFPPSRGGLVFLLSPRPPILPKASLGRMIHSRRKMQDHDDFQTRCSLHGHPRHQVGTVCAESRGPRSAEHTALWTRTLSSSSGRDGRLGSNFVTASAEGKREEERMEALGEPGSSGRPRLFLKCPPWIQAVLAQRITGLMTVCPPWLYSSCCGCREESGWGEGIRSETRGSPTSYSDSGGARVAFVGPQQCPRKWKVSGLRVAGTWPRWALGERWALCFQRSERRALALAVTISGACHDVPSKLQMTHLMLHFSP